MRSVRKYCDGFQNGSGWTEVDEMLCLAAKRGLPRVARKIEQPSQKAGKRILILPATLERWPSEMQHILVTRTAIKYVITHSTF